MYHCDVITSGFTTYCMLCFHLEIEKIKPEAQIKKILNLVTHVEALKSLES